MTALHRLHFLISRREINICFERYFHSKLPRAMSVTVPYDRHVTLAWHQDMWRDARQFPARPGKNRYVESITSKVSDSVTIPIEWINWNWV